MSTHYSKYATNRATRPNGRLDLVFRNMLEALPLENKQRLLQHYESGSDPELWQTGEGLWNCRIRVGNRMTHCARPVLAEAIDAAFKAEASVDP